MNNLIWKLEPQKDIKHLPDWVEKFVGVVGLAIVSYLLMLIFAPVFSGRVGASIFIAALLAFLFSQMYLTNKAKQWDSDERLEFYEDGIFVNKDVFYNTFFNLKDMDLSTLCVKLAYYTTIGGIPIFLKTIMFYSERSEGKVRIFLKGVNKDVISKIKKIFDNYKSKA